MKELADSRERLTEAIGVEMRKARSSAAMPVREVAQRVIAESEADPALFEEVVDALCALCIRSGIIIEFTRPGQSVGAAL
jgi:hypothetical protein